jgi:hypothetical protein
LLVSAEHVSQNGTKQLTAFPKPASNDLQQGCSSSSVERRMFLAEHGMTRAKLIPASITVADCPYCDGENVLGSVRRPGNQAHEVNEREIACRHCQCIFLLSEAITRIRSFSLENRKNADAA